MVKISHEKPNIQKDFSYYLTFLIKKKKTKVTLIYLFYDVILFKTVFYRKIIFTLKIDKKNCSL